VVISLRSLEPVYDLETLIKAVPTVVKKLPQAIFLIAGEGSQREYLESLANNLGIFNNVKFTGSIPNSQLPDYLTTADVYVSTSLSDAGLSASTAEAMACGLPVVITDSGENRRWVKDGEGGFLIPVRDPESLADRILYLLGNEKTRSRFGERNREIIMERNNYLKEMKRMEGLYKKVIASYE
jgi:glycosyltransferase involved in cell wall biosynthesis